MTPTPRWRELGDVVAVNGLPTTGKLYVRTQPTGDRCPHGDVTCPCQDMGDPCHYEGSHPMACPNPPCTQPSPYHCHVEGCEQRMGDLAREHGSAVLTLTDPCALTALGDAHPLMHPEDVQPAMAWLAQARRRDCTRLDLLRGTPSWHCGLRRAVAAHMDDMLT